VVSDAVLRGAEPRWSPPPLPLPLGAAPPATTRLRHERDVVLASVVRHATARRAERLDWSAGRRREPLTAVCASGHDALGQLRNPRCCGAWRGLPTGIAAGTCVTTRRAEGLSAPWAAASI